LGSVPQNRKKPNLQASRSKSRKQSLWVWTLRPSRFDFSTLLSQNGGFVPDFHEGRSFVINQLGGFVFQKALRFQPSAIRGLSHIPTILCRLPQPSACQGPPFSAFHLPPVCLPPSSPFRWPFTLTSKPREYIQVRWRNGRLATQTSIPCDYK